MSDHPHIRAKPTDEAYFVPWLPSCRCPECLAVSPEGQRVQILLREIVAFDSTHPIVANNMADLPDELDIVRVPGHESLGQVVGFADAGRHEDGHHVAILIAVYPRKVDPPYWAVLAGWYGLGAPRDTQRGQRLAFALN